MNIKKELVKAYKNLMSAYFDKVYSYDELKISDKSVGGKVEMVQADGSLAPVPDGDYVMDDGFSFTVKDSVIESIVGEEAASTDKKEEEAPVTGDTKDESTEVKAEDVPVEDQPAEDSGNVDLVARVEALESAVDKLYQMIQGMSSQNDEAFKAIEVFNTQVKTLNDNITTLAKVPVEFSKTNKTVKVEETKQDQMMDMARILGSLSKK